MPPAWPLIRKGMGCRPQLRRLWIIKRTQQKGDDRCIVDRAKRTAAGGAEGTAAIIGGAIGRRHAACPCPADSVARKLYPGGRCSPRMATAHIAGTGVGIARYAGCLETNGTAQAAAVVFLTLQDFLLSLPCAPARLLPRRNRDPRPDAGRRRSHSLSEAHGILPARGSHGAAVRPRTSPSPHHGLGRR